MLEKTVPWINLLLNKNFSDKIGIPPNELLFIDGPEALKNYRLLSFALPIYKN